MPVCPFSIPAPNQFRVKIAATPWRLAPLSPIPWSPVTQDESPQQPASVLAGNNGCGWEHLPRLLFLSCLLCASKVGFLGKKHRSWRILTDFKKKPSATKQNTWGKGTGLTWCHRGFIWNCCCRKFGGKEVYIQNILEVDCSFPISVSFEEFWDLLVRRFGTSMSKMHRMRTRHEVCAIS